MCAGSPNTYVFTDRPHLLRLVHAMFFFIKFKFKSSGSVWFNVMRGILWDYWKIFTHYFHCWLQTLGFFFPYIYMCVLWELIFIVTRQGVWQIHFIFFQREGKPQQNFEKKRMLLFFVLYLLRYTALHITRLAKFLCINTNEYVIH